MSAHLEPDDDAATLRFGPEFPADSCECLSDAEVTTILDNTMKISAVDRPFLRKTFEYTKRSIGMRPVEAVKSETIHIRQALQELRFDGGGALHVFEIASLTNLMSKDSEPEEAKALIPSLARYDDDAMATILEAVASAKQI